MYFDENGNLNLIRDSKGAIIGFSINAGRARDILFECVKYESKI